MTQILPILTELKERLEAAAFMVSRGGQEKEAHSEVLRSLILVNDLEAAMEQKERLVGNSNVRSASKGTNEKTEVNKVSRRLRLWAKRQDQINSKILNAFLELERAGNSNIREEELKSSLIGVEKFESNFIQMKTVAEKNHGKIFEQTGEIVQLWAPVEAYVREYEKKVFENHN